MSQIPVGLQLYSLRDAAEKDILATIASVGEMGYDGIEFAGYFNHSASDIRNALDNAGLQCCGAHVPISDLTDENFEATIAFHKEIGCPYAILPWLPREWRDTHANTLETCKKLTELDAKVRGAGLQTGFHAHDADMKPLDQGISAWYIIAENTPETFLLQYDTCNGAVGGADPIQPIFDHPGRSVSTHLKGFPTGSLVGEGEIDWARVQDACEGVGGVKWYIIEHETYIDCTPEEACQKGLDNWKMLTS